MSRPRYTSPNQFANMLDKRAIDLDALAERIALELTEPKSAAAVRDSADLLRRSAEAIRFIFRGPNKAPPP